MRGTQVFVLVSAALCLTATATRKSVPDRVRVHEEGTRLYLMEDPPRLDLSLENLAQGPDLTYQVRVELLDPNDAVLARASHEGVLPPGRQLVGMPLRLAKPLTADYELIGWHRLRHTVVSAGSQGAPETGILPISEILSDFFEVTVAGASSVAPGSEYKAVLRAFNPWTRDPHQGIQATAELEYGPGQERLQLTRTAATGSDGCADVTFKLPPDVEDSEARLRITAWRGHVKRNVEIYFEIARKAEVQIETDKPLYQPGQTLHLRALVFDTGRKAVPDATVHFSVRDPEGVRVYSHSAPTSRFGVATLDWDIPNNTRLGRYLVRFDVDGLRESGYFFHPVRVSRYTLPGFVVRAEPDRDYYRPGEAAEVAVSAAYLFGEPVEKGAVRLVREKERVWDFYRQRWATREAEEIRGTTGEDGVFHARIDLSEIHEKLDSRQPGPYGLFRDLQYAAYFTDPSTGRTEERRFDIRVTHHEIHVYVREFFRSRGSPVSFYLEAVYADGTPAPCEITYGPADSPGRESVRTNRFGLARGFLPEDGTDADQLFEFEAVDDEGRAGLVLWSLDYTSYPRVHLGSARTLHRSNEPIELRIRSPRRVPALLAVETRGRTIHLERIELRQGENRKTIPYRSDFSGKVLLKVELEEPELEDDFWEWGRSEATLAVLYPSVQDLRVDVALDKESYLPGSEATASFEVTSLNGSTESVIGVAVLDQAVEERAGTLRLDRSDGWRSRSRVAGFDLADLMKLDAAEIPDGLDLVAEVILRRVHSGYSGFLATSTSRAFEQTAEEVFQANLRRRIERLGIAEVLGGESVFPRDTAEFEAILRDSGIDLQSELDAWGQPYHRGFETSERKMGYVTSRDFRAYEQEPNSVFRLTREVSMTIGSVVLRTMGPDRKPGTNDDFEVTRYSGVISKGPGDLDGWRKNLRGSSSGSARGSIGGTVADVTGGIIPGVEVIARGSDFAFTTVTDDAGWYLLPRVPEGEYSLLFQMAGFRPQVIDKVPVKVPLTTIVDCVLRVGAPTMVVEVASAPAAINVQPYDMGPFVPDQPETLSVTPRLRSYFPETLVWAPELETKGGRAKLHFSLGDNITTWTLRATASTPDGRISTTRVPFKTFQEFFLENDPPSVLTAGDEIALPVVVRNYEDKEWTGVVEVQPQAWLALTGSRREALSVAPGESSRVLFDLKALSAQPDAPVRASVLTGGLSDAVEKSLRVRPDGREITFSSSRLFVGSSRLEVEIPDALIEGSLQAEVKIYADALAHALDSMDGILRRPYGCAEQTISSSFPSLLVLRYAQSRPAQAELASRARRFLEQGYQRLLGYRSASGGFSYWGQGDPDIALTAYAVRFLALASTLIDVDDQVVREAVHWLVQQFQDGSWRDSGMNADEPSPRAVALTALVSRVIAETAGHWESSTLAGKARQVLDQTLTALHEVEPAGSGVHGLALRALAELASDEPDRGRDSVRQLIALSNIDSLGAYWEDEGPTPFYGWGHTGRIETTAVVVQALLRFEKLAPDMETRQAIGQGLSYLLSNKDRYGVWFSTKATVNVLEALVVADEQLGTSITNRSLEVYVNGRLAASVEARDDKVGESPISINLSPLLPTGRNHVDVRLGESKARATVQLVHSYYVPWSEFAPPTDGHLHLAVNYDRTSVSEGERITCSVKASRKGQGRYGMMLAEIGLPPGAQVERDSLERATGAGGFWEYEILPDRVVAYLWPRDGQAGFEFSFRPRFPMRAKSSSSILYDYYNPQARTEVVPVRFVVSKP